MVSRLRNTDNAQLVTEGIRVWTKVEGGKNDFDSLCRSLQRLVDYQKDLLPTVQKEGRKIMMIHF